jgi:hypothetical protein
MKISKKVTRGALTVGMLICWFSALAIVVITLRSHLSAELILALSGVAASLISTGFSQLGMLSQMKGD